MQQINFKKTSLVKIWMLLFAAEISKKTNSSQQHLYIKFPKKVLDVSKNLERGDVKKEKALY